MLNKLSQKYSKEISLTLIFVFLISGFASMRLQAMSYMPENYLKYKFTGSGNYLPHTYPVINELKELRQSQIIPVNSVTENREEVKDGKNEENQPRNVKQVKQLVLGGPGQPETSSFKPVGADNMVSPFTGDFSYNIPLLDVGGYPVNMFYNSGITMDQDASWVGLGWNINPGTINRNLRGVPDDFDGSDIVTEKQSIRPDETWGVSGGLNIKFAGFPLVSPNLGVTAGISFNNKLGIAAEAGLNPALTIGKREGDEKNAAFSYGAQVGAALNLSSRNGASLTPSISFFKTKESGDFGKTASLGISYTTNSRVGIEALHLNGGVSISKEGEMEHYNNKEKQYEYLPATGSVGALNSSLSYCYPTILPSIQNIYTRKSFALNFGIGTEWFGLNPEALVSGYYTKSTIDYNDEISYHRAYGYLHYQSAINDPKAMLDFNRVNDGVYTPNSPAIAMPVYTYDIFSITGEGTGGSFRAYRGDIGYMRDADVQTKDDGESLGLDAGVGNLVHAGADLSLVFSSNKVSAWKVNNGAAGILNFKDNDSTFQASYFRNPGEKAIPDAGFQNAIGGENLVRFKMANLKSGTPMLLPTLAKYDATQNKIGENNLSNNNTLKSKRDKRTQVISFLTAEEASRVGFDKQIYNYSGDSTKVIFGANCNKAGIQSINRDNSYRLGHHLSEIDVLGTDGRKYIYGLPVYNIDQSEVTFSIENGDFTTGKSTYIPTVDDSVSNEDGGGNTRGRDWFVKEQKTPAYARSFLLTELVSPNYVDLTGDGISEDDMGDAIKFNYSEYSDKFKWRTPVENNTAIYDEGLKTDDKDDKAHYVYGEQEMWVLYSIESKNMIARFYVKDDRKDAREVLGRSGDIDENHGMQRLDKICLYSKGDLVKYGDNAKPIKTIRFFQSYQLCQGAPNSISGNGKLTLDSIWITYNGNNKNAKNRFIFSYPDENNPPYDFTANDRWGNYKPALANPANLSNSDYPYVVQDQDKADKYAAAWTLNKIILPSGAEITVDYESDDYAYVQNRQAADLYQIAGFGNSTKPDLSDPAINNLYNGTSDNDYVYVRLPEPLGNGSNSEKQQELKSKYFDNLSQLYLKLSVIMPSGKNIPGRPGSEVVPVYGDIDSYGLIDSVVGHVSSTVAWVKIQRLQNDVSPMTQQALQFLKEQLPGKAFKGYDLSESSGMKAIVLALGGMISSFSELTKGIDNKLRSESKCRKVQLDSSFIRLPNPYLKKLGGGLRVKRVMIHDNWNKMTGGYESTYGQEYKYTTTQLVNNKIRTISSGVASWEPGIGADENPFKEIMRFQDHNRHGPYDFGAISLPLGEAFYPSPVIGYSKVTVLSIQRDTVKNMPTRHVSEFYTTKDFPFESSCTSLSDPEAHSKYEPNPILQLLHLDMAKSVTLSQGFLVDINDMNGKEKSEATYTALDSIHPVNYTEYFYNIEKATDNTYKFKSSLPAIKAADGKVTDEVIGRDIELMADFREHRSQTSTANVSGNFDLFVIGIFPAFWSSFFQPVINESTTYRSAALLKIVNHYGILDSIKTIDKGSMVSTKNLVYDAETGDPILTRTNNEFNEPVYHFSYPAHWAYSGMGPAYQNIDATYKGLNFTHGQLLNMPTSMAEILESGDELYTIAKNEKPGVATAQCDDNAGTDAWTTLTKNKENKIWAINTGKSGSLNGQWVFMDRYGNPYNAQDALVKIIRSGHRNMLDQTVASLTCLSNPIDNDGHLQFNDFAHVVQTSAATFSDHWKTDNAFFLVDSVVEVKTPVNVQKAILAPDSTLNVLLYHCYKGGRGNYASTLKNQDYFMAEENSFDHKAKHSKHVITSLVKYDLTVLPAGATIVDAELSLNSHQISSAGDPIIEHNLPPRECSSNGFGEANHLNSQPHRNALYAGGKDNSFVFTRVKKDWNTVSDNFNGWRDYLTNPLFNDEKSSVPHVATTGLTSSESFNLGGVKNCSDTRINVTDMVQDMQQYSSLPSIIKMELIHNNNYNLDDFNKTPETRVCFQPPVLYVYYYTNDGTAGYNLSYCDPYFPQYYYTTLQHIYYCLSRFTKKKAINPYAEGILGDWRADTSFVYYGDRKEKDPNATVDLRRGGFIDNYKPFWNFSNITGNYLSRNYAASDVWVWNKAITQYNRKGYETENKDPLGRYNSGLYGYNQQLPVSLASNARVREILFDGFEDYDYNMGLNCIACRPHRHFNFEQDVTGNIDSAEHHTGLKSLRIDAGQHLSIEAPLTDASVANAGYSLRIKIDSTQYFDTIVKPAGTGFAGKYFSYLHGVCESRDYGCIEDHLNNGPFGIIKNDPVIDFDNNSFPPAMGSEYFAARWNAYFQAVNTGYHSFQISSDDGAKLWVNGQLLFSAWSSHGLQVSPFNRMWLNKGDVCSIQLYYFQDIRSKEVHLLYRSPQMKNYDIIPPQQLYTPDHISDTTGTVIKTNRWCTRLDSSQVTGNALTDTFSLLTGRKMLISAWVKEGGNDCKCNSYTKNDIVVSYSTGASEEPMHPTGSIIEGWQRYESVFSVPEGATSVKITFNNQTDDSPVYFDDIRIHPFNANVKSFVYNGSNLRLMSELDDNNFATFYEYDDDGTLTRVKKETEHGIKTISETRNSMQKIINN